MRRRPHSPDCVDTLYRTVAAPDADTAARLSAWANLVAVITAEAARRGVCESEMAARLAALAHAADAVEARRVLGELEDA